MLDSLYIGATGMQAQQMNIDVISNNLANVNTSGFKRNRIDFQDLLYRTMGTAPTTAADSTNAPRSGMGTSIAGTGKVFTIGDVKRTDQPLDLAIRGQGFFEITMPDGTSAYTRAGAFQLNGDGMLVTQDGNALSASIHIPPDATSVKVDTDGSVSVTVPTEKQPVAIGHIDLVNFVNPSGLTPIGDNLYSANIASGDPIHNAPGQNGSGTVAQGFLEASNVKLIDEMINLIVAQRAYEINSKVVQASDEMLSISNGLFR